MRNYTNIFVLALFTFFSVVIFRNYFFQNQVPFAANLLVSYYQPYMSYIAPAPNKPMGFDSLRIFYPLRKLTIEQLQKGEIPLWNPYNFSGNTLLATYQSAVFHPFTWLFLLLPQIDAWSLVVIVQPILAGYFMYLFLKKLGLTNTTSIFGAFVFAFSGYMIVWWEESFMSVYSALFLPLAFYSAESLLKKISVKHVIFLTAALAFSILSGWFQATLYVLVFVALWSIYRSFFFYHNAKKRLLLIVICYLFALLFSAIHLIPSLEAYMYSARGNTDAKFLFDTYLLSIEHFITFLMPDFFGNPGSYNFFGKHGFFYESVIFIGIIPLLFALYTINKWGLMSNTKKFFLMSAGISIFLTLSSSPTIFLLYHLKLPFLSTIVPTRIILLTTFCLATLSAIGLKDFLEHPSRKKIIAILSIFLLLIIFAVNTATDTLFQGKNNLSVLQRNAIIPFSYTIVLIILFFFKKIYLSKKLFFALVFLLTIFSAFYFAQKYTFFSERKNVYPLVPPFKELQKIAKNERVWGMRDGAVENNFATYYHLYSPEGYDSFFIKRYGELLEAARNNGKFSKQIGRADALLPTNNHEEGILAYPNRKKLLYLLGVRYLLESKKNKATASVSEKDLRIVWQDNAFRIYQLLNTYPRAFLVGRYTVLSDNQEILSKLFNTDIDLQKEIVLEEKPSVQQQDTISGQVSFVSYKPNSVQLSVRTSSESLLFLSDNYYPGWKVFIDAMPAKLYRANYTFRAVVVPKGVHNVVFSYQPATFFWGALITIVTFFVFYLFCLLIKKRVL